MKKLFTLLLCLGGLTMFAQQGKTTITPTSNSSAQTAPVLNAKGKALVKEWKLKGTESYDLPQTPTDAQKNDLLNLMENGRYRLIYEGVAEGGTWTVDASGTNIKLTTDAGAVKQFKVLSNTGTELKVDYRDGAGTHNILIYSAPATPAPAAK
jgi:hypothetical protein